ncbi:dNA repair protein RecN [Prevotella sp. CAG:255]|uniref:DNA repair protein RecN n=1 Tax=Prevotella sp. CAG:255 TaxID=1262923 RepID=UPI0003377B6A|nr:DNA repair protein RecN [Prevotella sp. CAG:255]CCX70065.1 dNA repair protein RecN [Prevotella sp. CAG:255]
MLKQLYIRNFTLIDTLDIHFNPGFSVITGETGAGKSIILGAINLLLGQRADVKSIKSNSSKCVIEAHFDISRYNMQDFFTENNIDFDDTDCILRRELNSSGKTRSFINDTPVALNLMRTLGQQLIDIHSQHQNLLLNEEDFQLNVVDIIAKDRELLIKYKEHFNAYKDAKKAVDRLCKEIEENKKNEDYIRFQLKELTEAELKDGMQEELERESEKLSHVEEIKTALYSAGTSLNSYESDNNVLDKVKEASRSIIGITSIYPEISSISDRLESCFIELKDISDEINSEADNIEFDPSRLEQINSQLDKIYSLEQKYHVSNIADLINIQNNLEKQISNIDNSDEELDKLKSEEARLLKECEAIASKLTEIRTKASKVIEQEMRNRLIPLGIPNVRFSIKIENKNISEDGHDRISFLFSANTSTPVQPVAQVASGGEIARVMLSLKAMISGAVKLPTIIFDEIDTGVSGKIAEKMGDIMQEMGKANRQVISITHLPQIAAKGSTHYKVFKEETEHGTSSRMLILSKDERTKEIAQMLSGSEISDAAINNAKELLKTL